MYINAIGDLLDFITQQLFDRMNEKKKTREIRLFFPK